MNGFKGGVLKGIRLGLTAVTIAFTLRLIVLLVKEMP